MVDELNVTVMLGGFSAEREVSLRSGAAVVKALRAGGCRVSELDPSDSNWVLPEPTDVVFLALHGTYGEDGSVQERLEELGVAFTGCDAASSRLAFDKVASKEAFRTHGVATPKYISLSAAVDWPEGWDPPVVVKPVRQGSSVGLVFVDDVDAWSGALHEALRHDAEALVEQRIRGRELTVGLLAGEALPLVEVIPLSGVYDYRNKYTSGATQYVCPATIDADVTGRVQRSAQAAFRAVGGRDYGRVDVILDDTGNPWILEVNTLPGMTETSLLPKAAAAAGISFQSLCQRMIELAWKRSAVGA